MIDDGLKPRQALEKKLREIWDNEEFTVGVISNAETEENWVILSEFIDMAAKRGDDLISDDLVALSLVLGNERNKKENK